MVENYVNYIKSHTESDMRINQRVCGKDYSTIIGTALHLFLSFKESRELIVQDGIRLLGKLEEEIWKETGKKPTFHETVKCGLAINKMSDKVDDRGLEEIHKYATKLLMKPFKKE